MPRRENPRVSAALTVAAVLDGHSLDAPMREHCRDLSRRDQALAREIATGAVRHFYSLSAELRAVLTDPLKPRDRDVMALLLVGIYQLRHTRIAPHASVHATAEAARVMRKPWAVALINAVLRRLQREPIAIRADDEQARWDHPAWMIHALRTEFPDEFENVLRCNITRAPMALRVNLQRTSRVDYLARLTAEHIDARLGELSESAIILDEARTMASLPGFAEGHAMVQDEGAQLAAAILSPQNNHCVLDACAAPGGKACHLAEISPQASLTLLEADAERAKELAMTVERHGASCRILTADARTPDTWWDGEAFDRILLDAPCTATGSIRRHPDIRLLRRPSDADNLAATQRQLLCALWQTLKPDGLLLYCTCSLFRAENDGVISTFLEQTSDAAIEAIPRELGRQTLTGRQLLPRENANDGFFFSLMRKRR